MAPSRCTIEQDYEKRINAPMQMIFSEYDTLSDLAISMTQQAERFRKEWARSERHNQCLQRQIDELQTKCETTQAKHNIARQHFQKELKELHKFRQQRDNFYEIIELCKDLLCSEGGRVSISDNSSTGDELRKRFSVAQVNKLKSFKITDFVSEEEIQESPQYQAKSKGNKMMPFTTPRHGRNLGIIDESNTFDMTFDSDPDEPDGHSTKILESPPKRRIIPKRYSSDAVLLSHSTITDSSVAAGMDAGLYQAKKNIVSNMARRRPSNDFRRRSQRLAGNNLVESPPEPSPRTMKKRSRDLTPTRPAPVAPMKKTKVTPPNNGPAIVVPITPVSKSELCEMKKNLRKKHEWVHKTGIITGPKCQISGRKVKFNKSMWRCARCGMIVHPDAFDQAVKTECHAQLLKTPTMANLKKQVSQEFMTGFTTRQHNILLLVEEVERRRATVCEGLYRISGNVKEKNTLVVKLKEASHSLRLKRQILATQCKDHNSLCSLLKHYLTDGEPLLTFKLLPAFCVVACDENLRASERKEQMANLLEKLASANQQVLASVLRHLARVIESHTVNRMNAENMARSIGPSLVGYKNPQPTAKDYQTAPHYQRNVALLLFALPTVGNNVIGRALKKLQDQQQSYAPNPHSATPSTPLKKLFGR